MYNTSVVQEKGSKDSMYFKRNIDKSIRSNRYYNVIHVTTHMTTHVTTPLTTHLTTHLSFTTHEKKLTADLT